VRLSAWALLGLVAFQMVLGVWTLLNAVPMHLGLLHQGGALLVLAAAVLQLHLSRTAPDWRLRTI